MKIFYYDAYKDEGIESKKTTEASKERAIKYFFELTDFDGTFFGVINDEEKVVQFAWQDDNKWLVDIPYDIANYMSLQKYATYEKCVNIIKAVYSGTPPEKINGLTKVNIKENTLDEVQKNKAEI